MAVVDDSGARLPLLSMACYRLVHLYALENSLRFPPCKASSRTSGVFLRAESDGGDETGRRSRQRHPGAACI
eukprot:7579639-Alexandrium_andersonii.AAC.1